MNCKFKSLINSTPVRLLINIFWIYIAYLICRMVFIFENISSFQDAFTWRSSSNFFLGGLHFDTSAICYTNVLFFLLFLLPSFFRHISRWYLSLVKWLYVGINGLCVLINFADTIFFSFRLQRTTAAIFTEFKSEGNLGSIVGTELATHWYLVILFAVIIYGLIKLYRNPKPAESSYSWRYYAGNALFIIAIGFLCVSGMRGSILFSKATRPISINYAFHYTSVPTETGIVLNTPFSILRTIGRTSIPTPEFFKSQEQLEALYTPLHIPHPNDSTSLMASSRKNVVILILESFAKEFVGRFNQDLDNGTYKGYTPHLDQLVDSCMWFDEMIANTFYSIDAPPAVLASIPRADSPFVVSPHSVNHINSIASELKNMGYSTAFFHGADNESLGISAFIRQAGFDSYYGQTEFYADPRFGGKSEFDGTWGVWDEPFLQFFCAKLSEMPQPFLGSVFTLSSHHPFKVPEKYKDIFTDEGIFELHKAVKYSDFALYRFFEEARKQPWFNNTIFVLTADHTSSKRTHDEYKNAMGNFRIPILIYDPSGELPRGRQPGILQQIDIMPTLLNYLGYDKPYIAFGKDVLNTAAEDSWAINWNDLPTYIKGDYIMILNGNEISGMYNYKTDPLQKDNLLGKGLPEEKDMADHLKALVQTYLQRMNNDDVTVK